MLLPYGPAFSFILSFHDTVNGGRRRTLQLT